MYAQYPYFLCTFVLQNVLQKLVQMSVVFQPVVLPHQRKSDGTNLIRIRVTHQRKSKWIKTNITIYPSDMTKDGKLKNYSALRPAYDLIEKMSRVIDKVDMFKLESMNVDEVVDYVNNVLMEPEKFRLDFIEYGRLVASRKSSSNATTYNVAMNALERFFKGKHPDISEITVRNLRAFENFINEEKVVKVDWRTGKVKLLRKDKGNRAASLYLSNIRHIHKCARIEFNDPDLGLFPIPNDPFVYYSVPKAPSAKHRDISPDTIQLMIDTRHKYEGRVRMAIDAFLISFGLCGINAADLFVVSKPKRDILIYNRQKVKERRDDDALMKVRIVPCIMKIMQEYADKDRCFDYYKRYKDKDIFTTALNQGLRRWIKDNKQDDFTFYSARHAWATIGASKRCGISWDVIGCGLCHVNQSQKINAIYINQDWEVLWDANKKILGTFDWE